MDNYRIFKESFSKVYPLYINKAERKGKTKKEVDEIICWLTGYENEELVKQIELNTDLETFFTNAPKPNPNRLLIKGVICGVRVEEIDNAIMKEIRYLDKLIDELAKGKKMEKILRK